MLETRVFSFGVFADNAQINIVVTSFVPWDVLDKDYRGVDVEFLA